MTNRAINIHIYTYRVTHTYFDIFNFCITLFMHEQTSLYRKYMFYFVNETHVAQIFSDCGRAIVIM